MGAPQLSSCKHVRSVFFWMFLQWSREVKDNRCKVQSEWWIAMTFPAACEKVLMDGTHRAFSFNSCLWCSSESIPLLPNTRTWIKQTRSLKSFSSETEHIIISGTNASVFLTWRNNRATSLFLVLLNTCGEVMKKCVTCLDIIYLFNTPCVCACARACIYNQNPCPYLWSSQECIPHKCGGMLRDSVNRNGYQETWVVL